MFLKDRLTLDSKREYTDEGFLKVPAKISRTGIQEYLAIEMGITDKEPDSKIRVFRPEDEVFKQDSLQSFANKPLTNNHPPELLTAKNAKEYSVGHAGPDVIQNDKFAETFLFVTDADAIAQIESGKVELSNGYKADIDWTPGVTLDGESYDAIQRNIKGNHIAIVERGRAGPACKVADQKPEGDLNHMAKITIDGVDYEVSDQAAQAVGKLQASLKDAEEETKKKDEEKKAKEDEMEEEKKKAEEAKDSLQAKLDDSLSKVPTTETLDKLVAERIKLIDDVRKVAPDVEWKGKDTATLKKEVVAAKCAGVQLDSVSADYIDARFDLLVESIDTNSQHNLDESFKIIVDSDGKEVDNRPLDVIARDKMIERNRNAWKGADNK